MLIDVCTVFQTDCLFWKWTLDSEVAYKANRSWMFVVSVTAVNCLSPADSDFILSTL